MSFSDPSPVISGAVVGIVLLTAVSIAFALRALLLRTPAHRRANDADLAQSRDPEASEVMTIRLDIPHASFDALDFTAVVAAVCSVAPACVRVLSATEGTTVVRFVIHNTDNAHDAASLFANRVADETSEIHARLPILAFDAAEREREQQRAHHPAHAMSQLEDEYWDYERQIDLEGFNVRTLYDKVEDQTIHIVSQLANQRDDVLLLCDKILIESEALKDMFFKVKMDIDATTQRERDLLATRAAKMAEGRIEFDLPDDLKSTLTAWLGNFFSKQLPVVATNIGSSSNPRHFRTTGPVPAGASRNIDEYHEYVDRVVRVEINADGNQSDPVLVSHSRAHRRGPTLTLDRQTNQDVQDDQHTAADEDITADRTLSRIRTIDDLVLDPTALAAPLRTPPGSASQRLRPPPAVLDGLSDKDDSDESDTERARRSAARSERIAAKLTILRRTADDATLPLGFDCQPEGMAEWETARRLERDTVASVEAALVAKVHSDIASVSAGASPQQLSDAARMGGTGKRIPEDDDDDGDGLFLGDERRGKEPAEVMADAFSEEHKLAGTFTPLHAAVSAVATPVPRGLAVDPELAEPEAANRRGRRVAFQRRKVQKLRHARAVSIVALQHSPTATDSASQRRSAEALQDAATELLRRAPHVPDAVDDEAADAALTKRSQAAAEGLEDVAASAAVSASTSMQCPAGSETASLASQPSRASGRRGRSKPKGRLVHSASEVAKTVSPPKATVSSAAGLRPTNDQHPLPITGYDPVPVDLRDDSDCDDDERALRRECRAQFLAGRAAPLTMTPLLEPSAPGLSAPEKVRREVTTASFRRGQAAVCAVDAVKLRDIAKAAVADASTFDADPETRAAYREGEQRGQAVEIPPEWGSPEFARRRAAFVAGLRASDVIVAPSPFTDGSAQAAYDIAKAAMVQASTPREALMPEMVEMFHAGRSRAQAKAIEEFAAKDHHSSETAELSRALTLGRQAAAACAVPQQFEDDAEAVAAFTAATSGDATQPPQGCSPAVSEAWKAGTAVASAIAAATAEWADDVPLLDDTERTQRRRCRAAFLIGRRAHAAEAALEGDTWSAEQRLSAAEGYDTLRESCVAITAASGDQLAPSLAGCVAIHLSDAFKTDAQLHDSERTLAFHRGQRAHELYCTIPQELENGPESNSPAVLDSVPSRTSREQRLRAFKAGLRSASARSALAQISDAPSDPAPGNHESEPRGTGSQAWDPSAGTDQNVLSADAAEVAREAAIDAIVVRLKKDGARRYRDIKAKQRVDLARAMEELEEQAVESAQRCDDDVAEVLQAERRRLATKQTEEVLEAPEAQQEHLRHRHAAAMEALRQQQAHARRQAQEREASRSATHKAAVVAALEAKMVSDLRLFKTLQLHDEQQARREGPEPTETVSSEERKKRLIDKVRWRERRLKAKAGKEKEFLSEHAEAVGAASLQAAEDAQAAWEGFMTARVRALEEHGVISPENVEEEMETLTVDLRTRREATLHQHASKVKAERLKSAKALAVVQGAEHAAELRSAQEAIAALLAAEAKALSVPKPVPMSREAQATVDLLAKHASERQQLDGNDTAGMLSPDPSAAVSPAPHADVESPDEVAQREIRRLEREMGRPVSEAQCRAILEEAMQAAQSAAATEAVSATEQREKALARIEAKRRKQKHRLQQKQLHEIRSELRRQEAADAAAISAAKRVVVVPASLAPSAPAQQEEQAAIDAMKAKHATQLQATIDAVEAEHAAQLSAAAKSIEAMQQQKLADLVKKHEAEDPSKTCDDSAKQALMDRYKSEEAVLRSRLDAEASLQRSRLEDVLKQRALRKAAAVRKEQAEARRAASLPAPHSGPNPSTNAPAHEQDGTSKEHEAVRSAIEVIPESADKRSVVLSVLAPRHAREAARLVADHEAKAELRWADLEDSKAAARASAAEAVSSAAEAACAAAQTVTAIAAAKAEGDATRTRRDVEITEQFEGEAARLRDDLALELAELQLQQRVAHMAEVASALGLVTKAPETSTADELAVFRMEKEREQQEAAAQLEAEKESYERRMAAELKRREDEQAQDLAAREAVLRRRAERAKDDREGRLKAAAMATGRASEVEQALLAETRADESRLAQQLSADKERQQLDLQGLLEKRRARRHQRRSGAALNADVSGDLTQQGIQALTNALSTAAPPPVALSVTPFTVGNSAQPGVGADSYDRWTTAIVAQLQQSPLMAALTRIEKMLERQVCHGLVNTYVDSKDVARPHRIGRLVPLEPSSLTDAETTVLAFAAFLQKKCAAALDGPVLIQHVMAASSLPEPHGVANAFRYSYTYDAPQRTLFLHRSRLGTIGEAAVAALHATAHAYSRLELAPGEGSNDMSPPFLEKFYRLLGESSTVMFHLRLPEASGGSFESVQQQLDRISPAQRGDFLKRLLAM